MNINKLTLLIIALALLGCKERVNNRQSVVRVQFSTNEPNSKAYGSTWNVDDRIGIFMIKGGADFAKANIVADANNIAYLALQAGYHSYFTPNDTAQTILMPQDNSLVDFCAYSPYSEVLYSGFNIPINVQDQSNLEAIDYMLSNRVVSKSQNDNNVLLTFDHILSLLEITLEGGYGTNRSELENMRVTICNSKSYGSLSIAERSVSTRNIGDITTQKAGADLVIEAIVIPQKFEINSFSYMSIYHHGITYQIPLKFDFIRSKRHQIALLVEDKKVYISQQDVVIKGWKTGVDGSYEFEHKAIADGTKELDPTLFTLDNPHWVVRGLQGGDANQNYNITKHIRQALDALPSDGSANGKIVLEIEHITELPAFEALGVEKGAFEGYLQLGEVILSNSVGSLDSRSFAGCAFLKKVSAPEVVTIAESAFENCTSLREVEFPQLQTVGNYTFKGCSSLTTVNLSKLKMLSVEMFAECSKLEDILAPFAIKLYDRALSGCNSLAELVLDAEGEIKMLINPFDGFTNNANCILTLNIDKQQGGAAKPLITADSKWGPSGKELQWKQIKFK